jgi:hypothetical protein
MKSPCLRHQLIVLKRRLHGHARLTNHDRWVPCPALSLVSFDPVGCHDHPARDPRALAQGRFRCYWRWKSLPLGGRPQIETKLRGLIRRMSMEKPLWGAPRIHGELLKLGFEVAQSSVARCMVERWGRPARDGEPSCVTKRRTSPPWTCGRSRGAQCSAKLRQSPTMINVPMVTMVRPASSF